jgi:hypothetical protein
VEEARSFRYTSCPKKGPGAWSNLLLFDGIAYAYRLTGDDKLAAHLRKGTQPGIDEISGFGKSFGMYIRVTPHHLNTLAELQEN